MREAPEKQTDRALCNGFWAEHVRYLNVRVFGVFRGQNHQKSGSLNGII
ncbi:MAG: hypothetical protein LDL37_12555 [Asticcacaulis sp.]|nr:hypothetical protein [Asticcacaulis sp.]MCA1936275.1 hypothetical protein [Asticcacaulis sp.]